MDEQLFNPDGPALSILAANPWQVSCLIMKWTQAHREWNILRVRGNKSPDTATFFDEVAAALQFPYYFGENWDALWDCITDLNWLSGASFLIIVDSAHQLLSESDDFEVLLRVLADANENWRAVTTDFADGERRSIAFQTLLACEPDAADALTQRMTSADVTFVRLVPRPDELPSPPSPLGQ